MWNDNITMNIYFAPNIINLFTMLKIADTSIFNPRKRSLLILVIWLWLMLFMMCAPCLVPVGFYQWGLPLEFPTAWPMFWRKGVQRWMGRRWSGTCFSFSVLHASLCTSLLSFLFPFVFAAALVLAVFVLLVWLCFGCFCWIKCCFTKIKNKIMCTFV